MILRQFLHSDPVGISYLLGCGGKATSVVIDPVAEPSLYLQAAEATGMKINYVIDTHVHADHVSTGRALADAAGAEYVLSANADIVVPFKRVKDGDEIQLGNVVLKVLDTPGHTPEHICLLVTDRTRADEPWLLVTGHTLMIGDLGRTELAVSAAQGAKDLFRSVQRLRALPDYLEIFPAPTPPRPAGAASALTRPRHWASKSGTTGRSASRARRSSSASCSTMYRRRRPKQPAYEQSIPAAAHLERS